MFDNWLHSAAPVIGEVYMMNFTGSNHGQMGWRPGVVLQNNVGNLHSPNVIALPLTSVIKKVHLPTHVIVLAADSGLPKDGMVLCENPETMPKARMGQYLAKLSDELMKEIAIASLLATAAMSFLDEEALLAVRREAIRLNGFTA